MSGITSPSTTDTLNFGNGTSGLAAGTITVGAPASAGNITFAAGSGAIILSGDTITLGASTITVNNASNTINSVLAGTSLNKSGTGTLILTGANTYAGTTTISGGTLKVGDGTTGSLNGTMGTALTFSGTGTFNVREAAGSTQGMGALRFGAGDASIISTAATGSSLATLTFDSMAARTVGATGNFTLATNTNAFSIARSGNTFSLREDADGVYLDYTVIPETSTSLLGALGAFALLRRRR